MASIAFQKLMRYGREENYLGDIDPTDVIRIIAIGFDFDVLIVRYQLNGGKEITYSWGNLNRQLQMITLEPNEYITVVSGYYTTYITSLKVETNLRTVGPRGSGGGAPFELSALGGQIFGFHVRHYTNALISAIGVYVKDINGDGAYGGGVTDSNATTPAIAIQKLMRYGREDGQVGDIDPTRVVRIIQIGIQPYKSGIEALIVRYQHQGGEESANSWGDRSKRPKVVVTLRANEYIKAVKGHYSDIMKSIKLETNIHTYGPFGKEEGTPFEFSAPGSQILGFHARYTTECLKAIGVYVKATGGNANGCGVADGNVTTALDAPRKLGPSGGGGGKKKEIDPTTITGIITIGIRHGDCIDALIVHYERIDGEESIYRWGGRGGQLKEITLESNEYITAIRGHYMGVVRSIKLETNLRIYGPFGVEAGTPFEHPAFGGRIIGFHARSHTFLDAIGVYVKASIAPMKLGPSGGGGGSVRDIDPTDVVRINKIGLRHEYCIDALIVRYQRLGEEESTDHWGGHGGELTEITLQPNEYLTTVRGYYLGVVLSLKFETNFCTYGPFGTEEGTPFEFPTLGGRIIGFHARSESNLDAIGVYVEAPIAFQKLMRYGIEENQVGDIDPTEVIRIIAIGFEYDVLTVRYQLNGGKEITHSWGDVNHQHQMITLEPKEYITTVSGYHNTSRITSLKVETNLRTFGPRGSGGGTPFELSALGGQIFGFHARYTAGYIYAIGVYVKAINGHDGVTNSIDGGVVTNINATTPAIAIQKLMRYGREDGQVGDIDPTSVVRIIAIGIQPYESGIEALTIRYQRPGREESINRWGDRSKRPTEVVTLQANEYIKAVKGNYSDIVKSIKLETNIRTFGPFGKEEGTPFEFSTPGGQILGFHSRYTTECLKAIGVYVKATGGNANDCGVADGNVTTALDAPRKLGPSGGGGGKKKDIDPTTITSIITIGIRHGDCIDALIVHYERIDGEESICHWGGRGGQLKEITLEPNEYITAIRGHYMDVVKSIKLETNLRTYGPFGVERGTPFEHPALVGRIIGFHARSATFLDAIGVYVKASIAAMKLGPSGGGGGRVRDIDPTDVVRINKIGIRHKYCIDALIVHYQRLGEEESTDHWGGYGGQLTEITLQPNEYLTTIRGYYLGVVLSLKFETNFCTYGPFGTEDGTPFEFPALGSRIIGFHARSKSNLDAIGVYVEAPSTTGGGATGGNATTDH